MSPVTYNFYLSCLCSLEKCLQVCTKVCQADHTCSPFASQLLTAPLHLCAEGNPSIPNPPSQAQTGNIFRCVLDPMMLQIIVQLLQTPDPQSSQGCPLHGVERREGFKN